MLLTNSNVTLGVFIDCRAGPTVVEHIENKCLPDVYVTISPTFYLTFSGSKLCDVVRIERGFYPTI